MLPTLVQRQEAAVSHVVASWLSFVLNDLRNIAGIGNTCCTRDETSSIVRMAPREYLTSVLYGYGLRGGEVNPKALFWGDSVLSNQ